MTDHDFCLSRPEVLRQLACGVGDIGLSVFLADAGLAATPTTGRPPGPHHPARAKSLIFPNMMGGPSQFETFDDKPEMVKWASKSPSAVTDPRKAGVVRFVPGSTILPPLFKYVRKGDSGLATTEIFPHMAGMLEELCLIRTMTCGSPARPGGQQQALTDYARQPMPSLGSWILYGLGTENKNLPGFVYLAEGTHHGSGFLPAETQGMPIGKKLPNPQRPATITDRQQRAFLDSLAMRNRRFAEAPDEKREESILAVPL